MIKKNKKMITYGLAGFTPHPHISHPCLPQEGKPLVLNVVKKAEALLARDPTANKVTGLCR